MDMGDVWRCESATKLMPSSRILPVPPSNLGCLGGSAGGSEGLATPSKVQDRGQGLGGPLAEPGRNYLGKELFHGRWVMEHMSLCVTVPRHPSGSGQLAWRSQSHSATPPGPGNQKNLSVPQENW